MADDLFPLQVYRFCQSTINEYTRFLTIILVSNYVKLIVAIYIEPCYILYVLCPVSFTVRGAVSLTAERIEAWEDDVT